MNNDQNKIAETYNLINEVVTNAELTDMKSKVDRGGSTDNLLEVDHRGKQYYFKITKIEPPAAAGAPIEYKISGSPENDYFDLKDTDDRGLVGGTTYVLVDPDTSVDTVFKKNNIYDDTNPDKWMQVTELITTGTGSSRNNIEREKKKKPGIVRRTLADIIAAGEYGTKLGGGGDVAKTIANRLRNPKSPDSVDLSPEADDLTS